MRHYFMIMTLLARYLAFCVGILWHSVGAPYTWAYGRAYAAAKPSSGVFHIESNQ